ncbi:MAG TPA: two-component regulator propeller domain-containing protein, partial [Bacteroidia bacterium]|nr:two-component regulator propeller domain-containing protein [Bacteroidia bacterium]
DKLRNLIWIGYNNGGMQLFDVRTRKLNGLYNVSGNSTYDIFLSDTMAYVATIVNSLKKVSSPNAFKKHKDITQAAITINCIVNASNGRLYCGAWDNALHEFDYNTKLIKSYIFDGKDTLNFSADEIISIAEDENGILWCGTKNAGVLFFDLKTKTFTGTYKYVYNITTRVNCIYRDDYNRMWIGSQQGIFVYDRLMNQFEQTYFYNNIDKINCKVHQRLLVTGGTEYVVADCGLFYKKVNEVDYTFKNFRYEHDDLQLTSIYCDNAGTIFIGSNKTIFTLDTLKMELSIIPVAKQSVTQGFLSAYASRINSITGLQLDNKNYVINSFYGHFVSIVDLERKNYFMLKRTKPNNIENLVRKIYIDSKNRIWICGASKGLSQFYLPVDFHPDSFPVCDTLKHPVIITSQTWENEKSKTPFAINNVYDILENKDGSFWLTSQGNGLFKFYPDNKSVPFIPINGDYKSLQGIARGNANTVWIITSKGVLSYNTQTAQYKLYDAAHGIPESTAGYFFNENDSTLCAGFNGGF